MESLVQWLEANINILVTSAADQLAQSEKLRATVIESAEAFYDSLIRSLRMNDDVPLNLILLDWVEARSAPTDEDTGTLIPILTTLKEVTWELITKQHQNGDSLVDLLTQLEAVFSRAAIYLVNLEADALIKNLNQELQRAQANVARLNENKSNFIAVAAHELKTPLTLIQGYTNMLQSEYPEEAHPRIALMLTGIVNGSDRLSEIIQDMLDVSMLEAGVLELRYQPVWLNQLMDILEFETLTNIKDRRVEINIKKETFPQEPTFADPERLLQVLGKVVSNAVKFTPDGGKVTIYARSLTGFTEIVVEDTGIGIPAEQLQHIFETFSSLGDVSLHSSGKTKFKGGGAGLGLSIARGIIESHGGTIWAESPGYDERELPGSIFHIMIPMHSAPPEDETAPVFSHTQYEEAAVLNTDDDSASKPPPQTKA